MTLGAGKRYSEKKPKNAARKRREKIRSSAEFSKTRTWFLVVAIVSGGYLVLSRTSVTWGVMILLLALVNYLAERRGERRAQQLRDEEPQLIQAQEEELQLEAPVEGTTLEATALEGAILEEGTPEKSALEETTLEETSIEEPGLEETTVEQPARADADLPAEQTEYDEKLSKSRRRLEEYQARLQQNRARTRTDHNPD
jgi:hypothetical protein